MQTINYGIDLGTSNSAIAFASDGKVEVFQTADGRSNILPSAVMDRGGQLYVGERAYKVSWLEGAAATRFKRALGTNQVYALKGTERRFRPEDLAAEVLRELKGMASRRGHSVEHAVICTPAKFDAAQCEGTNEAARLAGIARPLLISEPMAASFGYGFTQERRGTWLVYDLGAGTFDAVVVRVVDGKLMPEVPEGDNRLGGGDMDRVLWEEIIVPRLAREAGIPTDHPVFQSCRAPGLLKAEENKIDLYSAEQTVFSTADLHGRFVVDGVERGDMDLTIRREELEDKIEPLVDRSVAICRKVLARCPDINEVLLVGGPTVMPLVRAKLRALGLPVNFSTDPMTAVATGAALYASTQPVPAAPMAAKAELPTLGGRTALAGPVALILDYEPTSEDEEAPVVVRCEDARAGWVEIDSASGNWTSGRVPANADGFVFTVPVLLKKANNFTVKAFTAAGALLPCEPAEFSIFRGMTMGNAPIPGSIRIEVEDPDDESRAVDAVIIERGKPLPARGKVTVRTGVELSRSSGERVLLKIWEGDRRLLRANRLAYSLELTGDMLQRKLPANSEIEITVAVDSSRLVRAEVYVSLTDEVFPMPKRDEKLDVSNPRQLEERRRQLAQRIEAVDEGTVPELRGSLDVCRNLLFNPTVNAALKTAKAGGNERGDACARVDEAIRSAEDEFVGLRERQADKLLPLEWQRELHRTRTALAESPFALNRDGVRLERIEPAGVSALERRRWNALRQAIGEVTDLRYAVFGRDPGWWQGLADTLPKDPETYANAEEAARLLERYPRQRDLAELRSDVVRLIRLLPTGTTGGEAEAATRVRLGG